MPEAPWGSATRWLTVIQIDAGEFGATREDVRLHLEGLDIEARPVWKPMHLQPVFSGCRAIGGSVAAGLFERGLCLPSGSSMSDADCQRVVAAVQVDAPFLADTDPTFGRARACTGRAAGIIRGLLE